ncbi:hypothetical protein AaE_007068 [Aphanomyces astaci]|uniref:Uncharacterized protein n=1 Tax=Aphanomyces astaci TaxID=112090 RepID=A0A6A5AJ68_APHAT|nr:hypothetical protein AaE_007068 [Aphanomyces astaci]
MSNATQFKFSTVMAATRDEAACTAWCMQVVFQVEEDVSVIREGHDLERDKVAMPSCLLRFHRAQHEVSIVLRTIQTSTSILQGGAADVCMGLAQVARERSLKICRN